MKVHTLDLKHHDQPYVHPCVLETQGELILIDCGYPGQLPQLEQELQIKNLDIKKLSAIIITHHDIDHLGTLQEVKLRYPSLKIYASEVEASYIDGSRISERLLQAQQITRNAEGEQKAKSLEFEHYLKSIVPCKVDYLLSADREPFKGVKVIDTPGHTPGHVSIYLTEIETLITADAIVLIENEFDLANPDFTLDIPLALESISKLSKLKMKTAICYHGGVFHGPIANKLQKLLTRYGYKFP